MTPGIYKVLNGMPPRWATLGLAIALAGGLIVACTRAPGTLQGEPGPIGPAAAVAQLAQDLRRNDLVAYARHALPSNLHMRMEQAWKDGRTIWPLSQLPLNSKLPGFVSVLSAPGAEKSLVQAYDREFSGAQRELRSAASTLGLFATQYVGGAEQYGPAEREHYAQLIAALSQWGRSAPLADRDHAKAAIPKLVAAARLTGLGPPGAFHAHGMERSLGRLGPFLARFKNVARVYSLDLDAALDSVEVELLQQTGDTATVQLRYTLAGQSIDAVVPVERRMERWYLSDLLRHAEAQAGDAAPVTEPVAAAR
ncbi:MAG: hypothetical protein H0T88_00200 [Lysobacter sp.]|nr:hypothetical protein [Lysobacter sp.]